MDMLRRGLTLAPTHGDYYRGNLLCRDRQLVGIIDWHDAQVDPLSVELAAATFELCKDESHALHPDRARGFVRAYLESGGPVPVEEAEHLISLMRVWIRSDAARSLHLAAEEAERAYALRQIDAFHALREIRFDLP